MTLVFVCPRCQDIFHPMRIYIKIYIQRWSIIILKTLDFKISTLLIFRKKYFNLTVNEQKSSRIFCINPLKYLNLT